MCGITDITIYGKVDADYWVDENGEATEMRDTYYENWEPVEYYCLECGCQWKEWEEAKKHLTKRRKNG